MSVENIREVLGRLQGEPDSDEAWEQLTEAVTSPDGGGSVAEIERLLGQARARHEQRREWSAVAQLLEIEIALSAGEAAEVAMQSELARIFQEELLDPDRALAAYKRLLALNPNDAAAAEAIENDAAKRSKWAELMDRYLAEAEGATDDAFRSVLYSSAADVAFRYAGAAVERGPLVEYLEKALALDPKNKRAAMLAERVYSDAGEWDKAARVLSVVLDEGGGREDRAAAGLRLGRIYAKRLSETDKAIEVYQKVLDLSPGQHDALTYLAEAYSATEQWDHLIALYEDQLRTGGIKPTEELGILLQIAMVNWRMRGRADAAEPYFDRVRRADPTHATMLSFFRERCAELGDTERLITILTDAQRALPGADEKRELATEIAKLAESQENAQKAIEQYKSVLRSDPDNRDARSALKRLYTQTEGWNALVELHRQDLERTPADDAATRVGILKEIAAIYRERVQSDQALVTVLTQIVQLDDSDIDAVRELTRVYESLGRWRDLLTYQQRLAELSSDPTEKVDLYRSAARRWLEQFSNVQNAVSAYEGLLAAAPRDAEAIDKLKELYQKRRAWPQLFDLYERRLADDEGDEDKIELLTEMSKLASERLDRGADAIALLKRILELSPGQGWVFDALEKQAEREKDYATVAEVLEQRIEASADEPTKLSILQKLGGVYADRLRDVGAATRTWKRVLEISPGHNRALRVLRDAYVSAGDYDGLEELYASQRDWEGLADFLSSAADKAQSGAEKVALSFRAARVFEEELSQPERAMRSYERILSVSQGAGATAADESRAASALVPIYEKEEKWARLPALYEVLLAGTDDVDERVGMLRKLAAVTGGPLSDKASALGYARRAYELNPDAEGLELLEAWSRAAGTWDPFVQAVESRLKQKKGLTKELRRGLRIKLAELYARELGKLDEAVVLYRELVEADPTDAATVTTLDELLRAAGRRDDLRWLFQLRAEQVEGEDKATVYAEWATLEEEAFGEISEAALLYRKVVDLDPARGDALKALARLLIAQGDHAGAAAVVLQHRDVSEGSDRAQREIELASLYLSHLGEPVEALEAAARALELEAHHPEAISILSKLVDVQQTRVRAAGLLEAEYAEAGDARREAEALRVMLEGQADPTVRLALHAKLADVEEEKLGAPGRAFDVILRALNEFPDDVALWDRAEELADKAGRPTDLAEAYRAHLVTTPAEDRRMSQSVEVELCERAAGLHDEKLGDPEGAMPYLERVLAVDATNDRAFARLKQILTSSERWMELEELYDKAAKKTVDDAAQVELLNEVALIAEEIIGDAAKAIGYYERILELDALHTPSLDALEKLYESQSRWADLARLLERRLETTATGDEAIDIRIYLGKIYLDKLFSPPQALVHVEEVLTSRQDDSDARELCERLLEIGELRQRAARILETVYEARDEVRSLVRVLDIRREGADDDAEKRELLHRISALRDERLHDDAGAFATLAELLPLEPEDAASRESFIEIGRRLGEHERMAGVLRRTADASVTPATRGEILMKVAEICEDLLDDAARAEQVYRKVIEIDPSDPGLVIPAAQSLGRIYEAQKDHAKLAEALSIEVRLEDNVDRRRELYEQIGELYDTQLDDAPKAIEAWKSRLTDDPADERALEALEQLYERTRQWRALVGVLRAREQVAEDASERRRTMVKAAQILAGELDDVPEAINAWRAVLEEFGPERKTLEALAGLYEKSERWADLAETLEADLDLAEEIADRLALYARLGDCRRLHQEDLSGALDAYREALALDTSHEPSRAALEQMLENAESRRDAAEILHPLYEADASSEKLLRVLEIEVEEAEDPSVRLETLQKALRTAEGPIGDSQRAFGYAMRGVREAAGEPDADSWISTLERLSEATGRWDETCQLYRDIVDGILDGDVQQDVRLRIGELARTKLDDVDLAIQYYRSALDARADDKRALVALEELYEARSDHAALLEILRMRADGTDEGDEKKRLLFRMAKLSRGPLENPSGAIETYEAILDIDLAPDAITALETLYAESGRYDDLVALYERQLDAPQAGSTDGPADLRVKIARIASRHLGDAMRAFDELGEALVASPAHADAVAELERLLVPAEGMASVEPEQRARAGEMLEPVYLRRADWGKVKLALDARLEASQDPTERSELLQRLATLHEEQLEDYPAALETVALLLHEDISDEGVWNELERLAKVASAERRLAEIYAAELDAVPSDDAQTAKLSQRTGEIYADLGEVDSALKWYRRAYEFEPESQELFTAIDGLLTKGARHGERVELYRAALDYRGGQERLEALHTIAGLLRRELGEKEQAIETYVSALDVDDTDAVSLDALTELYSELGRDRDLADLYLRRAEGASDPEQAAPYRLELATLLRTKLSDTSGAIDQLETIVSEVPWHEGAIKALEALTHDAEHKARVVDILRPLYERSDDWRLLIRLNEERYHLATDDHDKVAILRETAELWESRGQDRDRAFDAMRAAFDIDPEDSDTRTDLLRLAEALGAWEELAESLQKGADASREEYVKRDLLMSLAKVYDERLDDPRHALVSYTALAELDPSDPAPLDAMDTLSVLLADWRVLIGVLEKKSEMVPDDESAALWRRIASVKEDMLDDQDGAREAYERSLDLDASHAPTIDRLIALYEPASGAVPAAEQAERLVQLYGRRVELAGPEEDALRYDLNLRAARCYEESLRDRTEAIVALGSALDARPGDEAVLASLERLYRAEEMWDDLLENLKLQASGAEERSRRVKLRLAIGDLYKGELESPSEALEQYRLVLDDVLDDDDKTVANHAIAAVREIGEAREELRLDAAEVLEPVLRSSGRYDDLVAALELRLSAETEAAPRTQTLRAIAAILDEKLQRPGDAETALLRALEDSPDDAELHAEIVSLAERSDGFERYADALAQRGAANFDAVVARDLYVRLGRVAEERLKDDRRAVEAYKKAVEHAGDEPELLEALDRLHERLGDTDALAEVLERRVEIAAEGEVAELYYRLAVLQIESARDPALGLSTLRSALDRDTSHEKARQALEKLTDDRDLFEEAAEALENVYRQAGDNQALARLYDKRIQFAPSSGERVRMRLDLSRVLEERSGDAAAALSVLEKALDDDPADSDVLAEIERLAAMNDAWTAAANALEAAVTARLAASPPDLTPEVATDLWMRSAGWRKDRAGDAQGAERAFVEALKHDPQNDVILRKIEEIQRGAAGRERDLVQTLRRLAELEGSMTGSNEIRKEAKTIAETVLNDDALAEEILREMIATDDGDRWAMSELATLREKAKDYQEVFDLTVRQAELSAQAELVAELRHRAAEVARTHLANNRAAIDLYDQLFEDSPADEKAASALRELYDAEGMHSELLALLGRLVDLAETVEARAKLRLEAAGVCDKLGADTEAIDHLRAILDEDRGHHEATLMLSRLLEKTGRDEDLAELLGSQIDLAMERGEKEAELSYRVRLGEVQETRLGDADKAIETFRGVLERDKHHEGALVALARLHEAKGDKAMAAIMLEGVLERSSGEDAVALSLRLADLFEGLRDGPGVRRALERGKAEQSSSPEVRARLRAVYEGQGAWSELAELIAEDADAATEDSEKVMLLRKAADIHLTKRSDPAAAADLLARATELAPADRELLLLLCDAYSASGRGKKSVEVLQQIVDSYGGRRSKELATIHHRLARALLADGDREKALEELDIAFKIDPGSVEVLKDLGVLSLDLSAAAEEAKQKDAYLDRAQKTFRALLLQRLDDSSPITKAEVFYYLGEISHRQGDKKKAIQMLERALDNDKTLTKAQTLLSELKG